LSTALGGAAWVIHTLHGGGWRRIGAGPRLVGVPIAPSRPEPLLGQIFSGSGAIRAGLLTPKALRSRAWRRLFHDVYADSSLADSHELRCAAAYTYLLPGGGAIAGRSAAQMLGFGLADPADPVDVLVCRGDEFGPIRGLKVHTARVLEDEMRLIRGVRVTGPLRTCWDLAQWLTTVEAVVLIDRLLALGTVTREDLEKYLSARVGRRGWRRMRRVLSLVDARAESPQESRLRARLVLAGLPPPEVQFRLFHEGRFVARVDLAWPAWKLAVEYDGLYHVGDRPQMGRDRKRLNAIFRAKWHIVHVTADIMRDEFDRILDEIRDVIKERSRGQ
jgi:very-short-patch-repair endonuclease